MLRSRLFIVLISIIFAITMILTASFVLYQFIERSRINNQASGQAVVKHLSASKIKENTVHMVDIGTNMSGLSNYIRLSIAFELDSKKSKEEFVKIDFIIRDFVIRQLTDLTPKDIHGKENLDQFTSSLISSLNNDILTYGKLRKIYITDIVMQ